MQTCPGTELTPGRRRQLLNQQISDRGDTVIWSSDDATGSSLQRTAGSRKLLSEIPDSSNLAVESYLESIAASRKLLQVWHMLSALLGC